MGIAELSGERLDNPLLLELKESLILLALVVAWLFLLVMDSFLLALLLPPDMVKLKVGLADK